MKFANKLTALFIIIGTIIAAAMFTIVYFQVAKILESDIKVRMENRAFFTMDVLDRFLSERLSDIKMIAKDPVISPEPAAAEEITERLIFFRNTYKCYASLSFFNLERVRIADTARLSIGEQNRMTRYWEDVLSGKVSAASDVHIAKDLQVPVVYFASAVNNKENKAIGVVVARIPTNRLFEVVKGSAKIQEEEEEEEEEEIDLINRDGLLIYSNHNREGVLKETLPEWESIKIAQREKIFGSDKHRNPGEKETAFYAFCREQGHLDFKGNDWTIYSHISTRVIFAPVNKLLNILVIMFLAMLPEMALVIYLFSKTVTRPLTRLSFAAAEIGKGKLDTAIEVKSKDEFGSLANTLSQMAANLKKTTTSIDSLNEEVAERKKAEEQLTFAKKEWEDTFDSISDIVTVHDLDYNILRANKAAESVFGLSLKELIATKCYKVYHKRDCPPEGCPSCSTLKTGKASTVEVYEPSLGIYVEIKAFPRFDEKKNLIGVVHIVRDITQRKKIEEDIRKAKDDLEKQAGTLDEQLKEAIKSRETMVSMLDDNNKIRWELESNVRDLELSENKLKTAYGKLKKAQYQLIHAEKMEAIGRMASGVAHEVKNPLGIILQGVNYFETKLPASQKNSHEMLSMMKKSVKRADSIVRALLDFSRTETLNARPEDINSVLNNSINLIEHKTSPMAIEVIKELGSGLPQVQIDRGKLEQLFVNLLLNAIYAMPEGGKLYIRTYMTVFPDASESLDISKNDQVQMDKAVAVEIEDTGTGITKENLKKIFDPFFTTKKRTEGTGLGLAVVKSIIEMHKGHLAVTSTPGEGTKFIITLRC
ncbi:MAG: ATP-binding protein [Candidatus Omnitrophota bacterium]